jgi:hypothetical protein
LGFEDLNDFGTFLIVKCCGHKSPSRVQVLLNVLILLINMNFIEHVCFAERMWEGERSWDGEKQTLLKCERWKECEGAIKKIERRKGESWRSKRNGERARKRMKTKEKDGDWESESEIAKP